VGRRQKFRETADNVISVGAVAADIAATIQHQLEHGHYSPSTLYGDGRVSPRIVDALIDLRRYEQKHLSYVLDDAASA